MNIGGHGQRPEARKPPSAAQATRLRRPPRST